MTTLSKRLIAAFCVLGLVLCALLLQPSSADQPELHPPAKPTEETSGAVPDGRRASIPGGVTLSSEFCTLTGPGAYDLI